MAAQRLLLSCCMFKTGSQTSLVKFSVRACLPWLMVYFLAIGAAAQPSIGTASPGDAPAAQIAKVQQAVADAKSSGDNAWMLMSSALVLQGLDLSQHGEEGYYWEPAG